MAKAVTQSDMNVASSNVNGIAFKYASVQSTYSSIWDELKRDIGSTTNATKIIFKKKYKDN